MKVGAIILAAGEGKRFGEKKQFIMFEGKPLYKHVYDKLLNVFNEENIVVVGVEIKGGITRTQSVYNGLKYFEGKNLDRVVILEAARPLVTIQQIKEISFIDYPSVSFVMPLVNTIVFKNGSYVNRDEMYELLVPQSFDYKLLYNAYCTNKYQDVTDDTRIIYEEYNIKPKFIETSQNLFKVTYQRDLAILESINELMKEGKI